MADILLTAEEGANVLLSPAPQPTFLVDGALKGAPGDVSQVPGPRGPGVPIGGYTGQFLAKKSNDDDDTWWVTANTQANSAVITLVGHGYHVMQPLFFTGSSYQLSRANNAANAEVDGLVWQVIDADHFLFCTGGYMTALTGQNLPVGPRLFLNADQAGILSTVEPTLDGQVSLPLFVADTPTSGYLKINRGIVVRT